MTGVSAPRGPRALALAALAGAVLVLLATGAITSVAAGGPAARGAVREYWVAAVPVTWNVVPNERNAIEGERFTPAQTVFRTVAYRQYTKDFAKQIPNGARQPGAAGPAPPCARRRPRSSSTSGTSTR